jgi:DNA-binding transcriptional ArsR family regulator
MISVDASTKKELKKQPAINSQTKNFSYVVFSLLRNGKNPTQICQHFRITPQNLQYYLNKLKQAGLIRKLGYGTWEVVDDALSVKKTSKNTLRVAMDNPQQSNLYFFTQDSIRGHAFTFTLKIPEQLRNWTNENREFFLAKRDIQFINLTTFGGGQRIIFKGRKVWLTNKSVIIYEKSSYLAETATDAKSHAIYNFISLIKGLERLLHADFAEHAGRQYSFKVSRQHYALVKNALAKQYDVEDKKLNIYSDKGLWFVIDNSFNLHEAETVHPETADTDSTKVQNFFNSLKEQPLTTGFILKVMDGIQQNQLVFAQNMSSHIKVIKDLGSGVNELASRIEELKQGHGQLSKRQRTLEGAEKQ